MQVLAIPLNSSLSSVLSPTLSDGDISPSILRDFLLRDLFYYYYYYYYYYYHYYYYYYLVSDCFSEIF